MIGNRCVCIANLQERRYCLVEIPRRGIEMYSTAATRAEVSWAVFLADVNFSARKLNIRGSLPVPDSDVKRMTIIF